MAKTVEHKTVAKVDGKITRVNILDGGNAVEILYDTAKLSFEEKFPIVRASELSLEDAFLKHEPTTNNQRRLKNSLIAGITAGLKDFRCTAIDPSLDEDENLVYEAENKPDFGYSAKFWVKKLKQFMPEKNSRMGLLKEHDALLGLLIKCLTEEEKWEVSKAWKAVCDDSEKLELDRCYNSENAKHDFETTGIRKVWLLYNLAKTRKIIADNDLASAFWHRVNFCCDVSCYSSLADVCNRHNYCDCWCDSAGWLVFDV